MSEHRMWLRSAKIAVVMVSAIALIGCSTLTRPAIEPRALAAPPAVGQTIAGTGYAFTVPAGWAAPPDLSMPEVDLLAGNVTDADGFPDNVNVLLAPANRIPSAWAEWMYAQELIAAGAQDVLVRHPVTVAGAETSHISAIAEEAGLAYQVEQYYIRTDAQTYVVTFSFSLTVPVAERDALSESVLASWDWF